MTESLELNPPPCKASFVSIYSRDGRLETGNGKSSARQRCLLEIMGCRKAISGIQKTCRKRVCRVSKSLVEKLFDHQIRYS